MATHVLIVDDDEWMAQQFTRELEGAGFTVDIVQNALAAISRIDARMPDVVVLDMFMPGPNGIVLLHELQSYGDLASIPIILCSNVSSDDMPMIALKEYGVRVRLDKATMMPGDLTSAVRKVLP